MNNDQTKTRLNYFPGCMLKGLAREYDRTLRGVASQLNFDLVEPDNWNCCGGPAGLTNNEDAAVFAGRNFQQIPSVENQSQLAVACAWCYYNLKTQSLNHTQPTVEVVHLVDVFSRTGPISRLKEIYKQRVEADPDAELVKVPCVAYYGCLLSRPSTTGMQLDTHDGPIEKLLRALNLPVKKWDSRETCCGAYHGFSNSDIAEKLSGEILLDALQAGARAIVTACPLCQYNLDVKQYEIGRKLGRSIYVPVYHFSEVMAYAVAPEAAEVAVSRHINSDRALVESLLKG